MRVHYIAFRLLVASLALCSYFVARTPAQTPSPSPTQEATKAADTKPAGEANPFAPEPAAPLPAGVTGSQTQAPPTQMAPGHFEPRGNSIRPKNSTLAQKT